MTVLITLITSLVIGATGIIGGATGGGGVYRIMWNIAKATSTIGSGFDITVVGRVMDVTKLMGVAIVVTWSVIDMLMGILDSNQGISGDPLAVIARSLMRLALGYAFIVNSDLIANAGIFVWNSFRDTIILNFSGDVDSWIAEAISNVDGAPGVAATVPAVPGMAAKILFTGFPTLFSVITQLFASALLAVNIVMAKVEFELRLSFIPIGVANVCTSGGINNAGYKYIKRMLACAMYMGGVFVVILIVGGCTTGYGSSIYGYTASNVLVKSILDFFSNIILNGIVGPFAVVSACGTLKTIINDAIGA